MKITEYGRMFEDAETGELFQDESCSRPSSPSVAPIGETEQEWRVRYNATLRAEAKMWPDHAAEINARLAQWNDDGTPKIKTPTKTERRPSVDAQADGSAGIRWAMKQHPASRSKHVLRAIEELTEAVNREVEQAQGEDKFIVAEELGNLQGILEDVESALEGLSNDKIENALYDLRTALDEAEEARQHAEDHAEHYGSAREDCSECSQEDEDDSDEDDDEDEDDEADEDDSDEDDSDEDYEEEED